MSTAFAHLDVKSRCPLMTATFHNQLNAHQWPLLGSFKKKCFDEYKTKAFAALIVSKTQWSPSLYTAFPILSHTENFFRSLYSTFYKLNPLAFQDLII